MFWPKDASLYLGSDEDILSTMIDDDDDFFNGLPLISDTSSISTLNIPDTAIPEPQIVISAIAFPGDERFKFNSGSPGHLLLPRNVFHEFWATDSSSLSTPLQSCSCTIASSSTGLSTTTPAPVPPSLPTTTVQSSLLTTPPSLTSPPLSQASILTGTNTFMTSSLDSISSRNPTIPSSNPSPTLVNGRLSLAGNTVCLGHGLDASVDGLLATIALSGLIGLLLWVSSVFLPHRCSSHPLTRLSYYLRLFDPVFVKYTD